ncbi:restriction endonuclease subunit S [Candidatus Poriferisodalis sp.]|uniref:restriction endonuclease subunit S n=1 Tax=Candidatus Poriferisodalis sp. TaxID=3101277 RepID=UPI003B01E38D
MKQPYPSYRDAEIGWLGDLPAHWRTTRLRFVASYRTSSVDKKSNADEVPVRLCNYTDVYYRERIHADDGEFMSATATADEVARFRLRRGDVLITKDSEDWRDIGVPALVEATADDFVCGYHLGIIRPGEEIDPGYLFRSLASDGVNKQLQVSATGVTRYGIRNGSVEDAVLPCPPLAEQRAIAMFLDAATARIDELVQRTGSKDRGSQIAGAVGALIERLQEYRSALISAAVTGKIDVRDVVTETCEDTA